MERKTSGFRYLSVIFVAVAMTGCIDIDSDSSGSSSSGLTVGDPDTPIDIRSLTVEGNADNPSEDLASIDPSDDEFKVEWDVDADNESFRMDVYLSSTDNVSAALENDHRIISTNCGEETTLIADGCDTERHSEMCIFDEESQVECGFPQSANVLNALNTDELPAEGYIIIRASRVLSDVEDFKAFPVRFN